MFQIVIVFFLFTVVSVGGRLTLGITVRRTWIELLLILAGASIGMLFGCPVRNCLSGLPPPGCIVIVVTGFFAGGHQSPRLATRWQEPLWR